MEEYVKKRINGKLYLSRIVLPEEKKEPTKYEGYLLDPNGKLSHRRIYKKHYGKIKKDWVVHHIDTNKKNNIPKNLISMPSKCHDRLHALMRKTGELLTRGQTQKYIQEFLIKTAEGKKLKNFLKREKKRKLYAALADLNERKKILIRTGVRLKKGQKGSDI